MTKGLSENAINNVKKAANVVVKPASIIKDRTTIATSGAGDVEERQDFDRDGAIARGFAGSVVPTLEEKTIFERRPSARHANGKPLFDALDDGEGQGENDVEEATVPDNIRKDVASKPVNAQEDGGTNSAPKIQGPANEQSKFGAPANANEGDVGVPNRDTKRSDASQQEQAAVEARATLRKHLSAKVGTSPVSQASQTPLHQLMIIYSGQCPRLLPRSKRRHSRILCVTSCGRINGSPWPFTIPRSSARFSVAFPTILSLLGPATRVSPVTPNDSIKCPRTLLTRNTSRSRPSMMVVERMELAGEVVAAGSLAKKAAIPLPQIRKLMISATVNQTTIPSIGMGTSAVDRVRQRGSRKRKETSPAIRIVKLVLREMLGMTGN